MSNNLTDTRLYKYSFEGKDSKLKSFLKENKNIVIDEVDSKGYTALYYSCLNGHKDCVKLLLKNGANPNERCKNDDTPVHAACLSGKTKILDLLIQYGGDLRLHDKEGRSPKEWAKLQTNKNLKNKMLSYIEEARHKVLKETSKLNNDVPIIPNNYVTSKQANFQVPCSVGFGTLHKTFNDLGISTFLPVVEEAELEHDGTGTTINNGAFMVYESMKWNKNILVTVKRLHEKPIAQGSLDLLIDELKFLSRIHFSNILQLMGVCYTVGIDKVILMFERVEIGSLFHCLHEKNMVTSIRLKNIYEIMLSICNALIYLHSKQIIHCYVSSHSILLTSPNLAKLANLEYAVEKTKMPVKTKKSRIVENHYVNCAYNWLAPEIMDNNTPTEMSDMYSFCVVMWELFNKIIPWCDMDWQDIKNQILTFKRMLPIDFEVIKFPFNRIIKDGLNIDQIHRMTFDEVKTSLENSTGSVCSNSVLNEVTDDSVTQVFEADGRVDHPRNNAEQHVVEPREINNKTNEFAIIKALIEKKKSKAPPPPQVSPQSVPQSINNKIKTPTDTRKQNAFNAFNSSSVPCGGDTAQNMNNNKTPDSAPTEKKFISSLTLTKRSDSLVKKLPSQLNRNLSLMKNKPEASANIEDNLQKPTPDEKRNYFKHKTKTSSFYDFLQLKSPSRKLDLSGVSVEDNTVERIDANNNDIQPIRSIAMNPNNFSYIYSNCTVKKPFANYTTDNTTNNVENENKAESTNKNINNNSGHQSRTSESINKYFSGIAKSGSYEKLVSEFRDNYIGASGDGLTKSHLQRGSSVDSARRPYMRSAGNNNLENQYLGSEILQDAALGASTLIKTSSVNKFFAGHGSVKDLVRSYEELPNKELNISNHRIQVLRQERNKEMLNVICKDKFAPVDESKYRIDATDLNTNTVPGTNTTTTITNTNALLPPKQTTSKSTPSSSLQSSNYSLKLDTSKAQQPTKRSNSINKKDLSTISERTERSSTATFIDTRDGTLQRLKNQDLVNDQLRFISKDQPDIIQTNARTNILNTYKSEAIILTNSYDANNNQYQINGQTIVPKLDFRDLSNRSTDIYSTNITSSCEISLYDENQSQPNIYNKNYIYTQQTDYNNNQYITDSHLINDMKLKRNFDESSQEDILSSFQCDDASVECSEAVYLTDFDSYANKYRSNSFDNVLNNNTDTEQVLNNDNQKINRNSSIKIVKTKESQNMIHVDKYILNTENHKDYECKIVAKNEAKNRFCIKSSIKDTSTGESLLHSEAHVEAKQICAKMTINS